MLNKNLKKVLTIPNVHESKLSSIQIVRFGDDDGRSDFFLLTTAGSSVKLLELASPPTQARDHEPQFVTRAEINLSSDVNQVLVNR